MLFSLSEIIAFIQDINVLCTNKTAIYIVILRYNKPNDSIMSPTEKLIDFLNNDNNSSSLKPYLKIFYYRSDDTYLKEGGIN